MKNAVIQFKYVNREKKNHDLELKNKIQLQDIRCFYKENYEKLRSDRVEATFARLQGNVLTIQNYSTYHCQQAITSDNI